MTAEHDAADLPDDDDDPRLPGILARMSAEIAELERQDWAEACSACLAHLNLARRRLADLSSRWLAAGCEDLPTYRRRAEPWANLVRQEQARHLALHLNPPPAGPPPGAPSGAGPEDKPGLLLAAELARHLARHLRDTGLADGPCAVAISEFSAALADLAAEADGGPA